MSEGIAVIPPDISGNPDMTDERQIRIRGILFGLVPVVLMGVILFISAGTLFWPAAWLILLVMFSATTIVTATCHAELITERMQKQAGAKEYDQKLVRLLNLIGLLPLLVAGLDLRFGWTGQMAFPVQAISMVLFLLGYFIFSWALLSNRFFSLIVRVQSEKGHHPVTTGPYRFVRHPGYLGFIIIVLAQPVLLGSVWAVIPAVVTAGLIVWRTALEDRTLQKELPGYREYTEQIPYRLIPGIW
ncbi:isoprenylcysteine carboxylmethyltransferase family protein [Methanoregula sp.]|uniref:methyltransferase family protein n=1 Tax=Methanoregula sp. TaxID=2052170 RepID=UPI00356466A7